MRKKTGLNQAEPPVSPRTIATRRRICKAALKEFARKGFEGASLRSIARKSGVTDALIHYHFGGKEQLWRSVVTELYSEMHRHSDAGVAAETPADELDEVRLRARRLMAFYLERPELHAIIAPEMQHQSSRTRFLIENFYQPRYDTALKGVQKAQTAGDLPPGDPALLNMIILSLASLLVERAGEIEYLTKRSVRDPALQEEYWAQVERLVFRRGNKRR